MQPLVQDAINEYWCVSNPYGQVIIKPARITGAGGNVGYAIVGWKKITLPNTSSKWHVYHVGQISPTYLNLLSAQSDTWVKVSDACVGKQLIIDLYNTAGINLPRTTSYYKLLDDKNLVFAIEINKKISKFSFDKDALNIRIYENLYFDNPAINDNARIQVVGQSIATTNDILTIQTQLTNIANDASYVGVSYCFVNGIKVPEISVLTTAVGDYVEYVYDGSIQHVVDIPYTSLKTFTSTLDNKTKFVIHYDEAWGGNIDHCWDIDLFLIHSTLRIGAYVHKNAANAMRMLTFKDYSIPATYVNDYLSFFSDPISGQIDTSKISLRLHIRKTDKTIIAKEEASKIQYLLKMPLDKQLDAMVGINASNAYWNADALEHAAIHSIMDAKYRDITEVAVENAYGYSGCNDAIAKNVIDTVSNTNGNPSISLPVSFQNSATAYEYSPTGVLYGFYPIAANTVSYVCSNADTAAVELVAGTASTVLDEYYGNTQLTFTDGYNYRYYTLPTANGTTQSEYQDVTNQVSQYSVDANDNIAWITPDTYLSFVRSDKKHLAYDVTLNPTDGVMIHIVNYTIDSRANASALVPFAEYDFWLNGHPLVEGIDYFFNFPTVQIVSKAYLNAQQDNTLTVRCFGLCKSDLTPYKRKEFGFVFDGVMSANGKYDLHSKRNLRVVCNGTILQDANQQYVEDVSSGSLINGSPYEVRQLTNAMNTWVSADPYLLLETDLDVEASVKSYLSYYVPEVTAMPINPIENKYALYSPFICKIIYALLAGSISSASIAGSYADAKVVTLVTPYTYLLDGDPINTTNTPDTNYVSIHPHWLDTSISLTADQYRFVANVVRIYANGLVNISTLLQIV